MRRRTSEWWAGGVVPVLAVVLAGLAAGAQAQSPDRVRLTDRTEVAGEIVGVSPNDVEIKDQRTEEVKKLPIDRIRDVTFGSEPEGLRNARNFLAQDAGAALDELAKIDPAELAGLPEVVLAELAYVKAAAVGRKAIATGADLAGGEKGLQEFLKAHARGYRLYPAAEILGDLLVRAGKYDAAAAAYAMLEKGPPAFKVRAATAKAGAFYEQKKYADADREYQAAMKVQTDPKDEASARQKRQSQAGRARCLARQGKAADAVKLLQEVVRGADPEDQDLLARVYAALGDAHRAAGQDQDALIAFLTVDLVYNSAPEFHAEALANLVDLWDKGKNPERSREAKGQLEKKYPASRWAKTLAAGGKG